MAPSKDKKAAKAATLRRKAERKMKERLRK